MHGSSRDEILCSLDPHGRLECCPVCGDAKQPIKPGCLDSRLAACFWVCLFASHRSLQTRHHHHKSGQELASGRFPNKARHVRKWGRGLETGKVAESVTLEIKASGRSVDHQCRASLQRVTARASLGKRLGTQPIVHTSVRHCPRQRKAAEPGCPPPRCLGRSWAGVRCLRASCQFGKTGKLFRRGYERLGRVVNGWLGTGSQWETLISQWGPRPQRACGGAERFATHHWPNAQPCGGPIHPRSKLHSSRLGNRT